MDGYMTDFYEYRYASISSTGYEVRILVGIKRNFFICVFVGWWVVPG